MVAILVPLTIILFLTLDYYAQRSAERRTEGIPAAARRVAAEPDLAPLPAGVFVAPGHAWMALEPAGSVRIGADAIPHRLLGGLDHVDVLSTGTEVERGAHLATLVRGCRQVELRSPVAGVIAEVNPVVESRPERAATDPFGWGWLYRIQPRDLAASLKRLLVAEDAETWMARELGRLRDFLSRLGERRDLAVATLTDGGLPMAGLAQELDEADWQQLTREFFAVLVEDDAGSSAT